MGQQVSIMQPPGQPGKSGEDVEVQFWGRLKDLYDKVREVASIINRNAPSRSVLIQVHNHTGHALQLESHHHNSGRFGEDPSRTIPPKTAEIFWSQRRRYRTEGSHGWVVYQIQGQQATCKVEWRLRWRSWRRTSSSSEVIGNNSSNFRITDSMGGGASRGEAKFELFERG